MKKFFKFKNGIYILLYFLLKEKIQNETEDLKKMSLKSELKEK